MIRSFLLLLLFSALLLGEQKIQVDTVQGPMPSQSALQSEPLTDSTADSSSEVKSSEQKLQLNPTQDSLALLTEGITVEQAPKPRIYNYRYQIVSGVAMMLFFGIMLGTSESMNPR